MKLSMTSSRSELRIERCRRTKEGFPFLAKDLRGTRCHIREVMRDLDIDAFRRNPVREFLHDV
jgi:hypothetical protein